jgi:hypothetical protein
LSVSPMRSTCFAARHPCPVRVQQVFCPPAGLHNTRSAS